jgi:hypothetical protein
MDMNAAIDHFPGAGFVPDPRQLKRVAAGIAISLALHALLLSLYRQPQPAAMSAPPEPLTVRLRPAPPAAPPLPAPAPQAVPRQAPPARPAPAKRTRPARPVIAVPPETRQSSEESYPVAPAADTPAQDAPPSAAAAPAFDMNAARGMARKLANEPDPAKAGTALERLPPKPLETESKLARGIGAAKRANCKDGIPGGLLAPLYLMMQKKDSGCKW